MSATAVIERMVVTTGGTGGHIFPAIAVADEIRRRNPLARVLFLGGNGPEGELARRAGLDFRALPASGVLGKGLKALLATVWVGRGVIKATNALRSFMPQVVIGFGGYAGFCPVLAAAMLGIPNAVHEQNSIPGVTNRLLSKFTRRVFVSFDDTRGLFPAAKVRRTGNPVRQQLVSVEKISAEGRNLLVLGGSQGAKALNDAVIAALPQLIAARVNILHQTGRVDEERVRAAYALAGADPSRVHGFVDDMAGAYGWADLALCRSGASTIFELAATGTPAILVPFPFAAHNHQHINAVSLAKLGAAQVLEQNNLSPATLLESVLGLLADKTTLDSMAQAAKRFAMPNAAAHIADGLEELCRDNA